MKWISAFPLLLLMIANFAGIVPTLAAPAHSPWNSSYFPNIPLVNQDGKKVRFYDDLIKGKVVAINFFFTHCKDMCPAETANLRRVEKLIGDRVGRDVFFYSISIDPKYDSPKALKEYAAKFGAGPSWTFLTGKESDITLLRKKLGLYSSGPEAQKLSNHTVSFLVGNESTGIWIKRSAFDHPKVLAHLLGSTLQTVPIAPAKDSVSYVQAQRIPQFSRGEDLFRTRCISCHSLGQEDGIGPGLAGVTKRRTQAWLSRWLKAPETMIEEKDPVALALFAKYNQVQMPNMSLSDVDVKELIEFLEKYDVQNFTQSN